MPKPDPKDKDKDITRKDLDELGAAIIAVIRHQANRVVATVDQDARILSLGLADVREDIEKLSQKIRKQNKPRLDFKIQVLSKERTRMPLDVTITNEQKVKATLAPKTATGKPAPIDGKPTWTVQSGDSTVVVADDGLSADLISSDTPGDTIFVVEADADIGEGVETLADTIRLTVQGARAANLGLSLGAPEAK